MSDSRVCVWFFWYPLECSPPGSSVHGISQVRIPEWVAISFCKEPPWTRAWTCVSCIAGRLVTAEPPGSPAWRAGFSLLANVLSLWGRCHSPVSFVGVCPPRSWHLGCPQQGEFLTWKAESHALEERHCVQMSPGRSFPIDGVQLRCPSGPF